MQLQKEEQRFEQKVHFSNFIIVYEFVHGLLELILGLGILFFNKQILLFYRDYAIQELLEDPHDLIINTLNKIIPLLQQEQLFLIIFLIIFGSIKIGGAIGLIYRKQWGLDILVAVAFILIPFDIYQIVIHFSSLKMIFLIVNMVVAFYLYNFRLKKRK